MQTNDSDMDFETWSDLFSEHARSIGYSGPIDLGSFEDWWEADEKSPEAYAVDFVTEMMPPAPTLTTCKAICAECPFKVNSAPGWLGPHTVDEILKTMQHEQPFTCHMQRTDETTEEDMRSGKINICRGFLVSATRSCKLFGADKVFGKELLRLQNEVRLSGDVGVAVLNRNEFRLHHTDLKSMFE